ncbi:MAG: pentapeptide repeat-containing protein [Nannocystaceae bacterium]
MTTPNPPLPRTLRLDFSPQEHGFGFANGFADSRVQAPPPHDWWLRIEGRAGGMVYAALDYWLAEGLGIPREAETPPDGDILADYLALRQRDAYGGVAAELVMAARVEGVLAQLRRSCEPLRGEAFVELSRRLAAGHPCPLGLVLPLDGPVDPGAEGRGHHVLAIGLRYSADEEHDPAAEVLVYDPSRPGREVVLRRDPDAPRWLVLDPAGGGAATSYGAWFLDRDYRPQVPDIREAHDAVVDLSHQDLRGWTPPAKQDLQDYRLVGADLRGHPGLSSLDLQGVDARGARLSEAMLRDCDLRDCDLRGASLRGTDVSGSTLDGARLTAADLRGATLDGTDLRRIDAAGGLRANEAELVGATLSDAVLEDASFDGATITDSDFDRARLDRAHASHAVIHGSRFVDASASGLGLVQAAIASSRFDGGADLRGAVLTQARVVSTSFAGADLRGATLVGATLTDVDLSFADLRGADLSHARLERVTLTGAVHDGSRFTGAVATDLVLTPDTLAHLRSQGVSVQVGQRVVRTSRAQVGGPALALYGGGAGLFAVRPGAEDLWRWDGRPHAWTRVGPAGASFAVTNDAVFGLTKRRDAVMWLDPSSGWSSRSTPGWTRIGGPALRLWAGGLGLFVEIPGSGELFRWEGAADRWSRVSGPAAGFAVTDTELLRLSRSRDAVQRWVSPRAWERVGGPASQLHASGPEVFATRPGSGLVERWDGEPDRWTPACEASAAVAVTDDELYRLTPSRDAVIRVLGAASLTVGGPADEIVAADGGLFAVAHRTRDVWRLA